MEIWERFSISFMISIIMNFKINEGIDGSIVRGTSNASYYRALYFLCFLVVAVCMNQSLYYVNSNICIVRLRCGRNRGLLINVVPRRHNIA